MDGAGALFMRGSAPLRLSETNRPNTALRLRAGAGGIALRSAQRRVAQDWLDQARDAPAPSRGFVLAVDEILTYFQHCRRQPARGGMPVERIAPQRVPVRFVVAHG